jgi:hypothetical protein
MFDKFMYKILGAIDDAFIWLDNITSKIIKFKYKKLFKKYTKWITKGYK